MKKLEKYIDDLFMTLAEISSLMVAGRDKKIIIQKLLESSFRLLDADRIFLLEVDGKKIRKYSISAGCKYDDDIGFDSIIGDSAVLNWLMKEGSNSARFLDGDDVAENIPEIGDFSKGVSEKNRIVISAPLVAKKSVHGLLIAVHRQDGSTYTPGDIKLITLLANQAAIAVENALLYQKVEKEAITDGLTGVYNYRYLISSLETEIKRAKRFTQDFSFVMMDVDNLKEYNDRFGHLRGSQVLKEIALLIKGNCREIDLVSKYGGDEFGIILPQTNMQGAEEVTSRIIRAVANHQFELISRGDITCSAGISAFPEDGTTIQELIANADSALYQAKRTGKNKLVTTASLGRVL